MLGLQACVTVSDLCVTVDRTQSFVDDEGENKYGQALTLIRR